MEIEKDKFIELRKAVHARLDELQFGPRRGDSKYVVIPQDEFGFGAQVGRRALGLRLGYLTSRTVVFTSPDYGPYQQCFEDTGNVSYEEIKDLPSETLRHGVEQDAQVVRFDFAALWADQSRYWEVHDAAPAGFKKLGLDHRVFEGMMLERLRPLEWFADEIERVKKRVGVSSPVMGVHIRRGDKHTENPYVPIRKYQAEIRKAVARTGISKVFVTSDDPGVFSLLPDPDRIEYIYDDEEPRYNNANHQLIEEQPDLRKQETLTALKIYELLRQCDYVLGQTNAHLTLLAVSRKMADEFGENSSHLISGEYTQRFRNADLADWGEVFSFKLGALRRKYNLPGVRSLLRSLRKKD